MVSKNLFGSPVANQQKFGTSTPVAPQQKATPSLNPSAAKQAAPPNLPSTGFKFGAPQAEGEKFVFGGTSTGNAPGGFSLGKHTQSNGKVNMSNLYVWHHSSFELFHPLFQKWSNLDEI